MYVRLGLLYGRADVPSGSDIYMFVRLGLLYGRADVPAGSDIYIRSVQNVGVISAPLLDIYPLRWTIRPTLSRSTKQVLIIIEALMVLACIIPVPTRGFGMGPPLGACVDMWPKEHGADAQTSDPPYTITVSKNTYSPGETLTVVVNTTINKEIQFFEGLLVQARRANCSHKHFEEAVGSFGLQAGETFLGLLNCQGGRNSAVGHIAHEHIVDKTFTWTAPAISVGHIYFRATVARRQKTFWTQVISSFVRDVSESMSPEICHIQTRRNANTCINSAIHVNLSSGLIFLLIMFWAVKFRN